MSRKPKPLDVTFLVDGAAQYTTVAGDRMDRICWRHYGHEWDTVDAVYAANRDVAELGPIMPADVTLFLPALTSITPKPKARKRLFD